MVSPLAGFLTHLVKSAAFFTNELVCSYYGDASTRPSEFSQVGLPYSGTAMRDASVDSELSSGIA